MEVWSSLSVLSSAIRERCGEMTGHHIAQSGGLITEEAHAESRTGRMVDRDRHTYLGALNEPEA